MPVIIDVLLEDGSNGCVRSVCHQAGGSVGFGVGGSEVFAKASFIASKAASADYL